MTIRGPLAWVFAAVLVISLATNVLIAGVVLGHLHGPPTGEDFDHIVSMIARPYPPEIQRAIMDGAIGNRDELRKKFDAMREARRKAFDAARADPFDPVRLEAANADIRTATDAMQQAVQRLEADAIAKAPADVRQNIRPPHGPFP